MHLNHEETPTVELRLNTFEHRTSARLEQKWIVRDGEDKWSEWREVPFVESYPGVRTPCGGTATYD